MILRPVRPQSPCGPPIDEAAGRVDQVAGVTGEQLLRQHRLDDLFDHGFGQIWACETSGSCWVDTTTVSIATGLPSTYFTVSCSWHPGAARAGGRPCALRPALHDAVRVVDRERHQLGVSLAGVAEHQALVAGALVEVEAFAFVHALGDVGRLAC
jgi:hypothetical protein